MAMPHVIPPDNIWQGRPREALWEESLLEVEALRNKEEEYDGYGNLHFLSSKQICNM